MWKATKVVAATSALCLGTIGSFGQAAAETKVVTPSANSIKLTDVIVTSKEGISLNFTKIEYSYTRATCTANRGVVVKRDGEDFCQLPAGAAPK